MVAVVLVDQVDITCSVGLQEADQRVFGCRWVGCGDDDRWKSVSRASTVSSVGLQDAEKRREAVTEIL